MSKILTYEDIKKIVRKTIEKTKNKMPLDVSILDGKSGIYGIYVDGICVYIGKSSNLLERIKEHEFMILNYDKLDMDDKTNKKYKMLYNICSIHPHFIYVEPIVVQVEHNSDELSMLESMYIKRYLPYFNIAIPNCDGSIDYYKEYSESIEDLTEWVFESGAYFAGTKPWVKVNDIGEKIEESIKSTRV